MVSIIWGDCRGLSVVGVWGCGGCEGRRCVRCVCRRGTVSGVEWIERRKGKGGVVWVIFWVACSVW